MKTRIKFSKKLIKKIGNSYVKKVPLNGWLLIDKPAGITSNKVIQKIKYHINPIKIGHAGTLDPDATGVLPVALGEATKAIPYLMTENKSYEATIRFGTKTDTDDVSGRIIKSSHYRPSKQETSEALAFFSGKIYQIPPIVSAVKVNGSRAYKLFHLGQSVSLKARKLKVSKIELISFLDQDRALISFSCGKGGYVRSIARDLGDFLGCFGCVETLCRTNYGRFFIKDSISLDSLLSCSRKEINKMILGIEKGISQLRFLACEKEAFKKLENGIAIKNIYDLSIEPNEEIVCFYKGKPVCIVVYKEALLKPKRKFNLF